MSDKNVTVSSKDTTDLPPVLSRTVALTEIQRDPALRVRVELSRERIAEFQAVMSNKDTQPLPPMECTEVGGELLLSDGWHRYEAHTALKHETVEVRVRKGSKADAFRAACMADRYCALPRTNADKNRAVTLALGMNLWRDRFIADMLAVSPNFVGQARKRIQVDKPADNTPKIGRDGKLHPPKTDEQKRKPANTKPTPAPQPPPPAATPAPPPTLVEQALTMLNGSVTPSQPVQTFTEAEYLEAYAENTGRDQYAASLTEEDKAAAAEQARQAQEAEDRRKAEQARQDLHDSILKALDAAKYGAESLHEALMLGEHTLTQDDIVEIQSGVADTIKYCNSVQRRVADLKASQIKAAA
jgi:hypothetical protein